MGNGGAWRAGTLQEYRAECWLREVMILAVWEGPSHRQILGLEVMGRKHAHRLLFQSLLATADASAVQQIEARIERQLALPREKKAGAEALLAELAVFTADALLGAKEK
jgi:acyl-CoA dehydrogenase